MNAYQISIENCIKDIERLRNILKKDTSVQVRSIDEKSILKATCLTWFNNHRPFLNDIIEEADLSNIDKIYQDVLALTDKSGSRKTKRIIVNIKAVLRNGSRKKVDCCLSRATYKLTNIGD